MFYNVKVFMYAGALVRCPYTRYLWLTKEFIIIYYSRSSPVSYCYTCRCTSSYYSEIFTICFENRITNGKCSCSIRTIDSHCSCGTYTITTAVVDENTCSWSATVGRKLGSYICHLACIGISAGMLLYHNSMKH